MQLFGLVACCSSWPSSACWPRSNCDHPASCRRAPAPGKPGAVAQLRRRKQQVQQFQQAVQGAMQQPGPCRTTSDRRTERFMRWPLAQAGRRRRPAKCRSARCVVHAGQVIAAGRNAPIGGHDPTAHAEIVGPARGGAGAGQLPAGRLRAVRHAGALRHVQRRHAACAAARASCSARPIPRPAPPVRCSTCSRSRG